VSSNINASEERLTQSASAQTLRRLAQSGVKDMLSEMDRQGWVSFLSRSPSSNYAPQSGEIVGILRHSGIAH